MTSLRDFESSVRLAIAESKDCGGGDDGDDGSGVEVEEDDDDESEESEESEAVQPAIYPVDGTRRCFPALQGRSRGCDGWSRQPWES